MDHKLEFHIQGRKKLLSGLWLDDISDIYVFYIGVVYLL